MSRSLTHELVRHRAGFAYSQLSQRYVDESEASFVIPPAIVGDEALEGAWRAQVESAQAAYVALVAELMERYGWVADKVHRRKMAREAARAVLPNATETKIVVTANARAWRTMLELRSSEGAELEIRRMAVAALRLLQQRGAGILLRLRDLHGRGSSRSGADLVPQSLSDARSESRGSADRRSVSHARIRRALGSTFARKKIIALKFSPFVFCASSSRWHFSCALASSSRTRRTSRKIETPGGGIAADDNRDWMTRIGFAYNQKPESTVGLVSASDCPSRAPTKSLLSIDDVFAEWDSADTIDAVASALSAYGTSSASRRRADFPERLRAERPDIVFNIAEGLHGTNREAHVPAICEFFDVPYSGSDPFTLVALPPQGANEGLPHRARNSRRARSSSSNPTRELEHSLSNANPRFPLPASRFPLFVKPVQEGSSKGITERNFVRTRDELEAQARFLLETYAQPVIVEAFLPGAEFTCGVLGNGATARVLPLVGMNFGSLPAGALPIYGYEAKWIWDVPSESARHLRVPGARSTRGSSRRSKTSCCARIACSAAATGRASTCASTRPACRTSSR